MQTIAEGPFNRYTEFLLQICRNSTMDILPHEQSDFVGDSLRYWKPVETV